MRKWTAGIVLLLVGCGVTPPPDVHMEYIHKCSDVCEQAVEEAMYAEGTSFIVTTTSLKCRCYIDKGKAVPK